MDKVYIAQRLKKYLFLISMIFVVLTTSHLIYAYIYSDAKETAIKGGTISEALIGQTPSLNPLKNGSANDKYINSIVYRSLAKYDNINGVIKADLAKCDTKNLLKIECFLETNIKWSNGDDITADDVIATFKTLKESKVNKLMNSLLKNTTIEKTKTSIIFHNTKKDINILKILFQPIVSQKILNIISKKEIEGNFSLQSGLYSGKYKITNILKDETSEVTTISLEKNDNYYKNNVYINNVIFKVFPNVAIFLKNKNSINIFNDKNNLIKGTVPKLKDFNYTLPQYINLFVNTQKITDNNFRNLLLNEIDRKEILEKLGKENFKEVKNPYLSDIFIKNNINNQNFKIILNKKGYYNIEDLEKKFKEELEKEKNNSASGSILKQIKNISREAKIEEEKNTKDVKLNSAEEKIVNSKSKIIFSPSWVDIYNFVSKDNYLLKGKTKKQTTAVYINDYKLKSFRPYSSEFAYRISEKMGNFKKGQNSYKIYFEIDGKKLLQEEIHFYRDTNKENLKKVEKDLFNQKIIVKNTSKTNTGNIEKTTKNTQKNIVEKIKENIVKNNNFTKSEKYIAIEKKLEQLKNLDKKYYYNKKLERYNLELYYVSNKKDLKETADYIADKLLKKGIQVSIREISPQDLNGLILENKKNYDLLLTGVNLSYFDFNIYPYYHSSQIKKGYNFSNFRKLDLDIVLEELKSKLLNNDKKILLEKKALKIIKENNLSKTLYTPILANLVDKNIKGYKLASKIAEDFQRFEPLYKSYVNQDKQAITDNKNFIGYIKFLINTLF